MPEPFTYGNGVVADPGYNSRLQLALLKYTKDTTKLLDLTYSYIAPNGGNNGQITGITDNTGTQEAGRSVSYTYDAWTRLKTALTTGSTAYPEWGLSWGYDRFGNRLAQNVTAGSGPSVQVTVDATKNWVTQIGSVAAEHDASGNMTKSDLNRYVYDAENRLTELKDPSGLNTLAIYTYSGPFRVKKVVGPTTTIYVFSGARVIAEYVNGALAIEYIYAGSQLLARHEGSNLRYHHADHLSVRVITDAAGTKIGELGHYPFGEWSYASGASTKWKFTTYERDTESGLDYAMFRYSSSRLGRFIITDPMGGHVLDPQSLNLYPYAGNDPVNLVDPMGLNPLWLFVYLAPFTNTGDFGPGGRGGGGLCYDVILGTTLPCWMLEHQFMNESAMLAPIDDRVLCTEAGCIPVLGYDQDAWGDIGWLFGGSLLPFLRDDKVVFGLPTGPIPPVFGPCSLSGRQFSDSHPGVDISTGGRAGVPVRAPVSGRVVAAPRGNPGPFPYPGPSMPANGVSILDPVTGLVHIVRHVSPGPSIVPGKLVAAGSIIGRTDQSGTQTNPHVHYEVRRDGKALDPVRGGFLPGCQ